MCYSAILIQNAKKLGFAFEARVQTEEFLDLFLRRQHGEKLILGSGFEKPFLIESAPQNVPLRDSILAWHQSEIDRLQGELQIQIQRQQDSRLKLNSAKPTKKAETDLRVSTQKIEKFSLEIRRHQDLSQPGDDDRIFPRSWMSMVTTDAQGQAVIRPARYLLRPHDKDADFDTKFSGCYNARRDGLLTVPWWKDALGKRHGLIVIRKFYERVENTEGDNREISFTPQAKDANSPETWLLCPTLWDEWSDTQGKQRILSAALITDSPRREVSAAGHDRTPIFLTPEAARDWLSLRGPLSDSKTQSEIQRILDQKDHSFTLKAGS